MNSAELQRAVEALQAELAQTSLADEATRRRLEALIADIHRHLAELGQTESTDAPAEPLIVRLKNALEVFEVHHPHLTATLQQLVDRLSELGI